MSDQENIRWKQRYENFIRSFSLLQKSLTIYNPSDIERAGIIQFFEMTFELAWKLLRDYLLEEGFNPKSPRESIKLAAQINIITDGNKWLQALMDRNLTVHTYDESKAIEIEQKIRNDYFPLLVTLNTWIAKKL